MTQGTTRKAGRLAFGPVLLLMATAASASQPLPQDVERFVKRREVCEHFRDEPWPEGRTPEDAERRSFIVRQLEEHCSGSDRQFASLRRKYRDDKTVIQRLERYEDMIEAK
jgi:hypothetical protein